MPTYCVAFLAAATFAPLFGQTSPAVPPLPDAYSAPPPRRHDRSPGAVREIGRGAGSIGTGALKGTGELAKGTGNSALDLLTLHPIDASASLGRGALGAGKDIGFGTLKGTGQISKGVGKAIRKIF